MHLRRLFFALFTFWMIAFGTPALAAGQDFYWKASYGRGAGTIPDLVCNDGKNQVGALCYDACREGYKVSGLQCAKPCPEGYEDRGPTCHWKHSISYVPEAHWDNCATKTKKRCTNWGGGHKTCVGGDCIGGLKAKCRDDYKNVAGVCWFDGNVPDGFSGTNLDPIKPAYPLPNPTAMIQVCKGGKHLQEGLCYESCRKGYHGVGPVCWGDTPPGYVDCFTGYAKNQTACGSVMAAQTSAAVTISMLAVGPALRAKMAATLAKYKEAQIKKAVETAPDIGKYVLENPKKFGEAVATISEAAAKNNSVKIGDTIMELVTPVFGGTKSNELFLNFRALGFAAGHANITPAEYFNVKTKEEAFERSRDVLSFLALCLSVYGMALPPTPTPSPVDVAAAVFDVAAAYMYTVYGE